ncbi:MAG TPA: hypothetical protein VG796_02950 [Verrucomicrobiales bacterium]|jgi:hypothetical protein|nr:hypothetical protein [Verrucomicrobiales bacterium]
MRKCPLLSSVAAAAFSFAARLPAQENSRTWEVVQSPTTSNLNAICYGNGAWLILGEGAGEVYRSSNGIAWQKVPSSIGAPIDGFVPKFLDGRFIVNTRNASWRESVDCQTWTPFPLPAGVKVNDLTYAAGTWVCVGNGGITAYAKTPGNWTVNRSVDIYSSLHSVIYLGGRFHAFNLWGSGTFSSVDGITWNVRTSTYDIEAQRLEIGEIENADGSVEPVVVAGSAEECMVGKADGKELVWEPRNLGREPGHLIYRRSADATRPGRSRREWVALEPWGGGPAQTGPRVYTLRESGEAPILENRATLNPFLAMAAGPDAMIAVGAGGVIRRYPTGPLPAAPGLNLTLRGEVEIKWESTVGVSYRIEESTDLNRWETANSAPLMGTGAAMIWTAPQSKGRRFFRLQAN